MQCLMSREGILLGESQPGDCYGGGTLRNCKSKGEKDNSIGIDVDSYICADVIVIDDLKSSQKRVQRSTSSGLGKNSRSSAETIILVDDDDGNLDDVQFVQPTTNPVNMSKCKRTYSDKASTSNHDGQGTHSGSAFSVAGDGLDFELEDSTGKLKEQWEKAFLKRKNEVSSGGDKDGNSQYFGREMLKETEDYKRAIELEMESRQRELQIQAEEARLQLQKRKLAKSSESQKNKKAKSCQSQKVNKAENSQLQKEKLAESSMSQRAKMAESSQTQRAKMAETTLLQKKKCEERDRLLDMERRQKQRVEEMRETQKKDEQNMNLKERLRAEVRKGLNILETTCHDMASILRGLGIDVKGGTANEVRLAFKRALLTFHPDRASRSDIRQQVEAEEKFKLINRMKEKFAFAT